MVRINVTSFCKWLWNPVIHTIQTARDVLHIISKIEILTSIYSDGHMKIFYTDYNYNELGQNKGQEDIQQFDSNLDQNHENVGGE